MTQQINLYREILNAGQKQQGLLVYALVLGALSLGVISFSAYREWKLLNVEQLAAQSRAQFNKASAHVDQLLLQQPSSEINAALVAEVADWQNTLNEMSKIFPVTGDKVSESPAGFSKYFQALARQSTAEIWLTNISITGEQQGINLEGSTFTASAVPVFLQKLQQEPIFSGKTFAKLSMAPAEQVPGQLDFKLSALLDAADSKDHVK